jgi:ferredoxin
VIVRDGFNSLEPAEELEEDLLDKAWGLEPTVAPVLSGRRGVPRR